MARRLVLSTFLILLSEIVKCDPKFDVLEDDSIAYEYTFNTINQIMSTLSKNYDLAAHIDNDTQYVINELLLYYGMASTDNDDLDLAAVRLINYDLNHTIEIPGGTGDVLHILILKNPEHFQKYMQVNKKAMDVAVFICLRLEQEQKSCTENLESDGSYKNNSFMNEAYAKYIYRIFVLEFFDDKGRLYTTCFYCGENAFTMRMRLEEQIQDGIPSNITNEISQRLALTFKNMEGQVLRISYVEIDVYMICIDKKIERRVDEIVMVCGEYRGVHGEMVTAISKIMNFTIQLVLPDRETRAPYSDAVRSAQEAKVEFSIGSITITDSRSKMVTFSFSFGSDPLRYLYFDPAYDFFQSLGIVMAFDYITWIILFVCVMIISGVIWLHYKYFTIAEDNFADNVWMISTPLIEQPLHRLQTLDFRTLIAPWLLCALIISSAYKGKMTAMVINTKRADLLSLDELAMRGYTPFLFKVDPSFSLNLLKSNNDTTNKALLKKYRSDLENCEIIDQALVTKSLMIQEQTPIVYSVNKICSKNMTIEQLSRLRFPTYQFHPSNHAWPFRNRSPLIKRINSHLRRIVQAGLYNKWLEDYLKILISDPLKIDSSNTNTGGTQGVKLNDIYAFFAIFLLWMIGIGFSLLSFVFEVLWFRIKIRRQPRRRRNMII